ncbi:MAG: tetratricopeptide repeat protein, partial [Verrucomicrobia bacterium]|nr:tetratricopeptide repeat protein [Verrucomicrobiota bacterium]
QREAIAIRRKVLAPDHPSIAVALINLSSQLRIQRKLTEAESVAREALAIRLKVYGEAHPDVGATYHLLGNVSIDQTKWGQASEFYRKAIAIESPRGIKNTIPSVGARHGLAVALRMQGQLGEAESLQRDTFDFARKTWGNDGKNISAILYELVEILMAERKFTAIEELLAECMPTDYSVRPVEKSIYPNIQGRYLARRGRWAAASASVKLALSLNPEESEDGLGLPAAALDNGKNRADRRAGPRAEACGIGRGKRAGLRSLRRAHGLSHGRFFGGG